MEPVMESSPLTIKTVEMHTGGQPLRIVESGYPTIFGNTILEKREFLLNNLDQLRTFLMLEPRGHHDQYGAVLVDPDMEEADIAVIFIHNDGYSTMCGHAVIALGRYIVDRKLNKHEPETRDGMEYVETYIQCPCGLVKATVEIVDGKSGSVSFVSVPAFLAMKDVTLQTKDYGAVTVDVGYGGAFYVFASDKALRLDLEDALLQPVVEAATVLSSAAKSQLELEHPDHQDLAFIYGTIVTDGKDNWSSSEATSNLCVFADRQVDRSPTGSGVTARIAVQYARGLIGLNQQRTFKNAETGSKFQAMAVEETTCGSFSAVRVQVTGQAHYIGECTFIYEEDDDMKYGFSIG